MSDAWSVHVIPVDDLIAHEQSEDCVCGPFVEFLPGGVVVTHHSLDGRELSEHERAKLFWGRA